MFAELTVAVAWVRARIVVARESEEGATAVEWLLITLAVIAIAGLAITAVRAYVTRKSGELNGQ